MKTWCIYSQKEIVGHFRPINSQDNTKCWIYMKVKKIRIKFNYKIFCSLKLQLYSVSFY